MAGGDWYGGGVMGMGKSGDWLSWVGEEHTLPAVLCTGSWGVKEGGCRQCKAGRETGFHDGLSWSVVEVK
jgi:hypothetical protein